MSEKSPKPVRFAAIMALAVAALLMPIHRPLAQQARPAAQQNAEGGRNNAAPAEQGRPRAQNDNARRLPANSITEQTVELPGRTLHSRRPPDPSPCSMPKAAPCKPKSPMWPM